VQAKIPGKLAKSPPTPVIPTTLTGAFMRVVLMSDIHGNLTALQAVAEHLPEHHRVIVAGDLCLEGPDPAGVFDLLAELGWDLLMGNTDRDIVKAPDDVKAAKRAQVEWARDQLGPGRVNRLASLPFAHRVRDGNDILALVVHANPRTMDHHLYPTMSEDELQPYLNEVDAGLLAFGHLHIPYVRPVGDIVLVDVSSVGHPKDHDLRAAYTIVAWDGDVRSVTQVRVPYDVERAVDRFHRSGMPDADKEAQSLLKASY
jgi:predicted phosphodiesterase